ncbi:hypothetical protein Lser_V15G32001 [Lactuca serriola]
MTLEAKKDEANVASDKLDSVLVVEVSSGKFITISDCIKNIVIDLNGNNFHEELSPIELNGFDIVFRMDWLSANDVEILCNRKMVRVNPPGNEAGDLYLTIGDFVKEWLPTVLNMSHRSYPSCHMTFAFNVDGTCEMEIFKETKKKFSLKSKIQVLVIYMEEWSINPRKTKALDKVSLEIVNLKVANNPLIEMPFKKLENCNQVVKIGKQMKLSLVSIVGNDIGQGNKKLILVWVLLAFGDENGKMVTLLSFQAYLWQLMRFNILQLLKYLRSYSLGKEFNNVDILNWANTKVRSTRSQSCMKSFKGLSDGILFNEILSVVWPCVINWRLVTKGHTDNYY